MYKIITILLTQSALIGTALASSSSSSGSGVAAAGFIGMLFIMLIMFYVFAIGLSIASLVFWIIMLIDVAQRTNWKNESDRTTWIIVVALTGSIGALIYYFAVKRVLDKK